MKKIIGIVGSLAIVALLVGCEEQNIMYEGKLLPESTVEEIIADKLEVDNPELDLEVNVTEEADD